MVVRTEDDDCLLCKTNKADKKGSHFTPASIIKKVIGDRDYEELYSINSTDLSVIINYGRSNLKNTDTIIRRPENVMDHVFCKICEANLGIIEGECSNNLNKIVDDLVAGKVVVKREGLYKTVQSSSLNSNLTSLFFYSIIWRQGLLSYLEYGTEVLEDDLQEKIRDIVYCEISKPKKEIKESTEFKNYPPIIVNTSYHRGDLSVNYFMPSPCISNPYLFHIGVYDVLLFTDASPNSDFFTATGLSNEVINYEAVLNQSPITIINIMTERDWSRKNHFLANYEADKAWNSAISQVADARKVSLTKAYIMLLSQFEKLEYAFPKKGAFYNLQDAVHYFF